MASEGGYANSAEYIQHHLTNLTYGKLDAGTTLCDGSVAEDAYWGLAHCGAEAKAMGFNAIHVDSMGGSIVLGAIFLLVFRSVAKSAT